MTLPKGFVWSAVKAGIKASGSLDLALAEAQLGASAAAMFTRNRVAAAPVFAGKKHLRATRGRVRAVLVNAGNANCATGAAGVVAVDKTCAALAAKLEIAPAFVFPSSTGIIGVPLPVEKLVAAYPALLAGRTGEEQGLESFKRAIMTTDTRPKQACATIRVGKREVTLCGVAKGSGMIHPNLATMLVYIFTDVAAEPRELAALLKSAVSASFNSITVDGDTSTNDTVLLLASGASGVRLTAAKKQFAQALVEVCSSLAEQIVADGEGVKHVIELRVEGAASDGQADKIARTIAHSMLVKTAWAGADPNWGRILAAAGRSGVAIDPSKVDVYIAGTKVCRAGGACEFNEDRVHQAMLAPRYEIRVRVGRAKGIARLLTTDLTAEYVHINADYST